MTACQRSCFALLLCVVGIVAGCGTVRAQGAAEALPAESRAVLDQFLGTWQTEATIARLLPTTTVRKSTGRGECTVTLGGRYYEFRTLSKTGDSELQVMTYDTEAKVFRQWVFSSDGYSHAAEGTWNAATNTLRWAGEADGTSFTIDDHFVEPGRLAWNLERLNAKGEAVQAIKGTLVRTAP